MDDRHLKKTNHNVGDSARKLEDPKVIMIHKKPKTLPKT